MIYYKEINENTFGLEAYKATIRFYVDMDKLEVKAVYVNDHEFLDEDDTLGGLFVNIDMGDRLLRVFSLEHLVNELERQLPDIIQETREENKAEENLRNRWGK